MNRLPASVFCLPRMIDRHWLLRIAQVFLCLAFCNGLSVTVAAQQATDKVEASQEQAVPEKEDLSQAPTQIDVNPVARDDEIRERLQNVLEATGWFSNPEVSVKEGVVFLKASTETDELKSWAGDLARNTQDVVAVANRIEVLQPSIWDFRPALAGLLELWRDLIGSLPFLFFGLIVLGLSVVAGIFVARIARSLLHSQIQATLLRNVVARSLGAIVFLIGT